jgi:hypothetical protein
MSRREDPFLSDVTDAKPPLWPPADEWVDSERGRRVLERVLATDRAAGPRTRAQHRRAAWFASPRLVFAVGGLAVVALAVALALIVASQVGHPGKVTQSTRPAPKGVTGAIAVADLMPLYRLSASNDWAPIGNGVSAQVDQAVALGLVTPEEASGAWASSPLTQGQYAELLVTAFGNSLLPGTFPQQPIDPKATSAERQAISALVTSGVILPQDGEFAAGEALTTDTEDLLLTRIKHALNLDEN